MGTVWFVEELTLERLLLFVGPTLADFSIILFKKV